MPSFTFNQTSNPMMTFFVSTIEEYLHHGNAISDQLDEVEGFLADDEERLDPAAFQDELENYDHFLLQTLDDYVNCLNYFRVVGAFECRKLLNQQRDYIDIKMPALKLLESQETIEQEVREAIDTVFNAIDRVRAEMSEETKAAVLNLNSHADEFSEATDIGRFVQKDDMEDRMEYNFWLNFSRRLDFYDLSEQMRDYMDALESDPEERHECIKARLVGMEQEMFPAHMCALDGYSEEEIDLAKNAVAREKEEREQEARDIAEDRENNLLDFQLPDEDDEPEGENPIDFDEANLANPERPLRDADKTKTIAEINKNRQPQKAEIIPLDRFRKPKIEP